MEPDIRDRHFIEHEDVLRLNFVRDPNRFLFRRHYRQGLRSHIMEVLTPQDVLAESAGVLRGNQKWFPRAVPLKVLRIFRARFLDLSEALSDIHRYKRISSFLTGRYLADSEEFIAEYHVGQTREILLCGLQTFIDGHILDPWALTEAEVTDPSSQTCRAKPSDVSSEDWIRHVQRHAARFVADVRRMILEARLIPDLAGIGNLLLTPEGALVLVDINNITRVMFDAPPVLDEKGYPTCDKSIEALCRIETYLLTPPAKAPDPIYDFFLTPQRMAAVDKIHRAFNYRLKVEG